MAEIRKIGMAEKPPENTDHVLVERARNRFVATGSATTGEKTAAFFKQPAFNTLEAAIRAANAWADRNSVPVIYVREDQP